MTKTHQGDRCEEILSAGFGGQGIMFLGKLLAHAGLVAGHRVTWMPSYGAEVRGGTSYSMAKVSTVPIASPIITHPDILIVMNRQSLAKYEAAVRPGGTLIWNRSLIGQGPARKDTSNVGVDATALAAELGDTKCANMIAAGAFVKRSKLVSLRLVAKALEEMLVGKGELLALNKAALEKGHKL